MLDSSNVTRLHSFSIKRFILTVKCRIKRLTGSQLTDRLCQVSNQVLTIFDAHAQPD